MRCPYCGTVDDKVVDTRTLADGAAIRRRRECCACGRRFTSYERIEEQPLMVVKRDGRREPFDRGKLERGVRRALEKLPVSAMSIERLVNEIEDSSALLGKINHEIGSAALGDLALEKLWELDKVAYIRFASVYRQFKDVDEFIREIQNLGCPDSG